MMVPKVEHELAGREPTVSVVITNYNYGRYLPGAVESAHMADEIIIVDDGSTDDSRDIIRTFDSVTPILKPNGGFVSAINAGFAASRGDVVIFLDADDRLLDSCIPAVKSSWTPDVSKLQWSQRFIDDNGVAIGGRFPEFTERHTPRWCCEQMRRQNWYLASPTSGNAWSRSLLDWMMPVPQYERQCYDIDDYMSALAVYSGEVVSLTDVHSEYRIHVGQMSRTRQFSEDRLERDCVDAVGRFRALNEFLREEGHLPLDALNWSTHTLQRMFMVRLGRSSESIWPLIPRHVTATLRQDSHLSSKMKNVILGVMLIVPYRPLASWLAAAKYRQ